LSWARHYSLILTSASLHPGKIDSISVITAMGKYGEVEILKDAFYERGGGVLPIMAYTGRLRPKGVPFSGFRYIKG